LGTDREDKYRVSSVAEIARAPPASSEKNLIKLAGGLNRAARFTFELRPDMMGWGFCQDANLQLRLLERIKQGASPKSKDRRSAPFKPLPSKQLFALTS
jgi:hypothetical protein